MKGLLERLVSVLCGVVGGMFLTLQMVQARSSTTPLQDIYLIAGALFLITMIAVFAEQFWLKRKRNMENVDG